MTDLPIHVATLRYDHMRPLIDGTVRIDGVEASFHTPAGLVPELFEDMVRLRAYDAAELGLTFYCRRSSSRSLRSCVAIPVFVNGSTHPNTSMSRSRSTSSVGGSRPGASLGPLRLRAADRLGHLAGPPRWVAR